MITKWIPTAHKGLRYYEHSTRRHGKKKDRYYAVRFRCDKKLYEYGIGWWSDGIPEQAHRNDPDMGFEEYALTQMKLYKANIKDGSGPKSPKEKRKIAEEKKTQAREAQAREEIKNITFKQYFEDTYFPISKTSKKKSSFSHEKTHFHLWIEPILGNIPLRRISKLDIERIKKRVLDAKKAPRTAQYVMATIRQIWNQARREGLVAGDSPTRNVKIPKFDNRRQRFLSHAEANILLKKLKKTNGQVYQMAFLALYTGLRASEIFRLTWGCIDTERGIVSILDAKSGRGRKSFMTEALKGMFLDMPKGKHDDPVFPNSKGGYYTEIPHPFREAVSDLKFNEGVQDRRQRVMFHSLRHTFGSWHAEAGTDLYAIKSLMGHGSITLTERYSHLSQGTLQTAAKNIERANTELEQVEQVVNFSK